MRPFGILGILEHEQVLGPSTSTPATAGFTLTAFAAAKL